MLYQLSYDPIQGDGTLVIYPGKSKRFSERAVTTQATASSFHCIKSGWPYLLHRGGAEKLRGPRLAIFRDKSCLEAFQARICRALQLMFFCKNAELNRREFFALINVNSWICRRMLLALSLSSAKQLHSLDQASAPSAGGLAAVMRRAGQDV